ncbi:hypothetical protein TNCT_461141 [Trichonephila clavata]|uniref:Uncharacterized protein n=1 Tax=Trichonephila clavata TaxID=2740835 RepID=A0A8X6IZU2_TRICU|nr:hypothetical protein TNCT_461141 [Trichonephila clavata]
MPGLGRGLHTTSGLQSPSPNCNGKSLKIIHCNVNGNSTPAMRVKLDRILDLEDKHGVQIIDLQEKSLRNNLFLKYITTQYIASIDPVEEEVAWSSSSEI